MPASNRSEIRVKGTASDRAAYEFGPYRFEPFNLRLLRGDEVVPLAGKAADTLLVLLRHADTLVSKDQLMAEVWPDATVEENNLNQQIYLLRKALTHGIVAADRLLAVQKNNRGAWDTRSKALLQLGRGEEGVHALAQNLLAERSSDLDRAVGEGGAEGGLRKALELTDDWRGRIEQSWRRASWRALLHDIDGALDELERAIASRRLNAINLGADPVYDGVRAHPRFRELLDRVGLTSYFSR